MKPFTGCADQMIGPNLYGYLDQEAFYLGEKGGAYVLAAAEVSPKPKTSRGQFRLPFWSDVADRLVVACPRNRKVQTTSEENWATDNLVWVHQIERDPEMYRHDCHPMSFEAILERSFLTAKAQDGLVTIDSCPPAPTGLGSWPTGYVPKTP